MPASQEADRRAVTVLFADLAGFTALAEALDPEDVRALQADLLAALRAVLEPLGAFIEKFVGDAVVAVFGAPTAHEDDPQRALHAALRLHGAMASLNARWADRLEGPLALHIGVNTGRVVAGRLGTEYAVTGDAVNTAARLQQAAQAGETLVSEATWSLVRDVFTFVPAGELALKGKAAPLKAFLLRGALQRPQAPRGLETHGLAAPMMERDRELSRLRAAYRTMLASRAILVAVVGEAGTGKSRLVAEFVSALDTHGASGPAEARRVACSSLGEPPFGVMARFFREEYGIQPEDGSEAARAKIAAGVRALGVADEQADELAPLVGYVLGLETGAALGDIAPERLKTQILMLLRMALERRLAQRPQLLVIEDLHWADAASIEGLGVLMEWLADRPAMLVFTARPDFNARALGAGRTFTDEIRLGPLSSAGIEAMLAALFGAGAAQLPVRLRTQIAQRAGGNPFYLEEIVRGLIARGALVHEAEGWTSTSDAETLDVPPTIEGLLLSRIDRLSPPVRRYLQEAAVLGPVFRPALLAKIADPPHQEPGVPQALRQAGLLEPLPGGAWRFTHALIHEVAYGNLLQRARTELHGRVGRALEALHGPRPKRLEDLSLLGHHFSMSEDRPRGGRYLVAAGDWARRIYANEDALIHYRRALATLEACADCKTEVLEVHERLGDLLGLVGERREAVAHYETVQRAAHATGERPRQARAGRKLGALHWEGGERNQGLACFRAALALLEPGDEHIESAYLCQEMGRLAFRSGDNVGAVEWAERALRQAEGVARLRREGDREAVHEALTAIAHALNTLGVALARLDRTAEAVRHIERSVSIALEAGLLHAACRGYANLGVLYASLDPGRAIQTCLTGLEAAKKIGDFGFQSRLYANLAVAYCALTDRCDADGLRAAQAAIELDRKLGLLDHLAVPLIVLGQIHQCHGDHALAGTYYREALSIAERIGEPQLLFPCHDGLATLCLDRGDTAQAEAHLREAAEIAERAGLDRDSLVVLPFLG